MEKSPSELISIRHLQEYPIVVDGYNVLESYLISLKSHSVVIRYSCNLFTYTISHAVRPLACIFHNQIDSIDMAINQRLYWLDRQVPAIRKPTSELVDSSVDYCVEKIKPITEGCQRVVSDIQQLGACCGNHVIESTNHWVDHYLPSDSEEQTNVEEEELIHSSSALFSQKMSQVLQKAGRRSFHRGCQKLSQLYEEIRLAVVDALECLHLLDYVLRVKAGLEHLNEEFWRKYNSLKSRDSQPNGHNKEENENHESFSSEDADSPISTRETQSTVKYLDNQLLRFLATCARTACRVLTVIAEMLCDSLDPKNQRRWRSMQTNLNRIYMNFTKTTSTSTAHTLTGPYMERLKKMFSTVFEYVFQAVQRVVGGSDHDLQSEVFPDDTFSSTGNSPIPTD